MAEKRGYFPRLSNLLSTNGISVQDVMTGTGLAEKSIRRMVNKSGYSFESSVKSVINFLATKGVSLTLSQEFVEAEI